MTLLTRGKKEVTFQIPDDTDESYASYKSAVKHIAADRKDKDALAEKLSGKGFDGECSSSAPMLTFTWQDNITGAAPSMHDAENGSVHQQYPPWGVKHLITPELATQKSEICPSIDHLTRKPMSQHWSLE